MDTLGGDSGSVYYYLFKDDHSFIPFAIHQNNEYTCYGIGTPLMGFLSSLQGGNTSSLRFCFRRPFPEQDSDRCPQTYRLWPRKQEPEAEPIEQVTNIIMASPKKVVQTADVRVGDETHLLCNELNSYLHELAASNNGVAKLYINALMKYRDGFCKDSERRQMI